MRQPISYIFHPQLLRVFSVYHYPRRGRSKPLGQEAEGLLTDILLPYSIGFACRWQWRTTEVDQHLRLDSALRSVLLQLYLNVLEVMKILSASFGRF
jgi:hypothetical protein